MEMKELCCCMDVHMCMPRHLCVWFFFSPEGARGLAPNAAPLVCSRVHPKRIVLVAELEKVAASVRPSANLAGELPAREARRVVQ